MTRLVSLHGRRLALDSDTDGIVCEQTRVYGALYKATILNAQVLALNATARTIVPAAPTGYAHILRRMAVYKAAGTAFAGIAAGEDLVAKYTNAAGAQVSGVVETTGFLDQATAQIRYVDFPGVSGATAGDITPVAAAVLVLHLLTGEITTGTSDLIVWTWVDTLPTVLDAVALG